MLERPSHTKSIVTRHEYYTHCGDCVAHEEGEERRCGPECGKPRPELCYRYCDMDW
jgi:hypothetical protein